MNVIGHATTRRGSRLNNRGFTMLELVSALAVIGLLAGTAVPFLSSFVGSASSRSVADELVMILNRARQLAIARNTDVCVRLENNSVMYRIGGCAGTVFVGADTDRNGNIALNDRTPVTAATNVVFTSIGAANPTGTYVVHNASGGTGVSVVVPASGRAKIQ